MPTFNIAHGLPGSDRSTWELVFDADQTEALEYQDGKSAALALEALRTGNMRDFFRVPDGHSLAIVKNDDSAGDDDWREREQARFTSGRYKTLPWAGEEYWQAPADHFAHIAEGDRTKVAFTESESKGRLDRQKVLATYDYLSRYSTMSADLRQYWCSVMAGSATEVFYANTSDEIEAIYLECGKTREMDSCMVYAASHFSSFCHPVRVYGAGDLALAYIRNNDGKITARALVWPEKQVCGRLYGGDTYTLKGALKVAGYSRFGNCALSGARLLRIRDDRYGHNAYVMPYIDGYGTFGDHEDGEHFCIEGEYPGGSTSGIAYTQEMVTCERCSDEVQESNSQTVDGNCWCNNCADEYAFTCERCDERCDIDNGADHVIVGRARWGNNSECWCSSCIEHSATYSESAGGYILDEIVEHCNHCSEYFPEWDMADAPDGERACDTCCESISEESDSESDTPAPNIELAPIATLEPAPVRIVLSGFDTVSAN